MSPRQPQPSGDEFWQERIAQKVTRIPPSGIRVFFDLVAARDDIISLGVGEPDFATPAKVVDAAIDSLRQGYTYYTGNQGLPSLRREIRKYLGNLYGMDYDIDKEILITVGVSEAVDLAFRAILNPGDGVLFGSPSYVSYTPIIELCDAIPQRISTTFEDNFLFDPERLESAWTPESKVLFLNYPSNPTGASFNDQQLKRIRDFVVEKDLLVISDEIYGELGFDFEHTPFSTLEGMRERTLFIGGFSKSFAMTGWRIGYAAGPQAWLGAMLKIHQYTMLCAPTTSQFAAEAALKYCLDETVRMKESYRQRRDMFVSELNRIGLETNMPDGAFYVFPKIPDLGMNSMEFATALLNEESLAAVPGNAFGPEGEGFMRCSYATSEKNLVESIVRMERFLNRRA